MKKSFRIIAALLAFCVAAAALPPPALAAGGTVHTLPSDTEWYTYFASHTLEDGDVIQCSGSMVVGTQNASDDPWIIDKDVTIEGGDISIHRGGILLGANVTFRNTSLYFTTSTRNARKHCQWVLLDTGRGNSPRSAIQLQRLLRHAGAKHI